MFRYQAMVSAALILGGVESGIDLFSTCAPRVQHGVGKLSSRATTLV
jgi:hypothetical protein